MVSFFIKKVRIFKLSDTYKHYKTKDGKALVMHLWLHVIVVQSGSSFLVAVTALNNQLLGKFRGFIE